MEVLDCKIVWPIVRPQALALACCFLAALVGAAAAKLQQGLVYGASHAFYVEAPQGWILDNTAGVNQGLHAVFYPGGSRWEDAAAVIYVNTAPREPECEIGRAHV